MKQKLSMKDLLAKHNTRRAGLASHRDQANEKTEQAANDDDRVSRPGRKNPPDTDEPQEGDTSSAQYGPLAAPPKPGSMRELLAQKKAKEARRIEIASGRKPMEFDDDDDGVKRPGSKDVADTDSLQRREASATQRASTDIPNKQPSLRELLAQKKAKEARRAGVAPTRKPVEFDDAEEEDASEDEDDSATIDGGDTATNEPHEDEHDGPGYETSARAANSNAGNPPKITMRYLEEQERARNERKTLIKMDDARFTESDAGNGSLLDEDEICDDESVTMPAGAVPRKNKPYPVQAFGRQAGAVQLIARAVQVSAEMAGSILLVMLSALLQPLINVSAKLLDKGCPVTLNMFIIAASGERKSSAMEALAKAMYEAIKRALDERRYMLVQDVTVDGLIVGLIKRCPAQFLLALEGASLIGGHAMSRENMSRFLGNVSSVYSNEPLSRTRVEEHHYAYDRRLSVLLFAQPIVAMDFLSSPLVMQQGLGNRFLYSQPTSLTGTRMHVDIELDAEPVYQQYCERITALASQKWTIDPDTGGVITRTIRLDDGAKEAWVSFYNRLERAAGPGGDMSTQAGYVTRFPEQVLRVSALLAMLDDPKVEQIDSETMSRAIELGEYYLGSALKLFNTAPANADEMDANHLLEWMKQKIAEHGLPAIPARMIYKNGPRRARPSRRTKELLTLLEERGDIVKSNRMVAYDDGQRSKDNYALVGM